MSGVGAVHVRDMDVSVFYEEREPGQPAVAHQTSGVELQLQESGHVAECLRVDRLDLVPRQVQVQQTVQPYQSLFTDRRYQIVRQSQPNQFLQP